MSRRSASPETGLPSGPIAVTLTDDCEPPSWLMASGMALTVSESARPDGPLSGGASVLLTVQPAVAIRASATAARRMYVKDMVLLIPKIAELDRDLPSRLDGVPDAIDTVEGQGGDHRHDVRARLQLHQRRFLFRDVPDQLEADRQVAARGDGSSDRVVEPERHVNARRVPA